MVQGWILPNNVIFRQYRWGAQIVPESAIITLVSPLYFIFNTIGAVIALKIICSNKLFLMPKWIIFLKIQRYSGPKHFCKKKSLRKLSGKHIRKKFSGWNVRWEIIQGHFFFWITQTFNWGRAKRDVIRSLKSDSDS